MSEPPVYDVAIIGAGVVGAAIAEALSHKCVDVVVIDAGPDVGTGTSKANTAIRHTGFDAKPGSLEAALLRRSYPLVTEFAARTGVPIENTGALLVAWDSHQAERLPELETNAHANGCDDVTRVSAQQVYELEPHLGPGATGGLLVPGEGIICPFTMPLALAYDAQLNGTDFRFNHQVTAIAPDDRGSHIIETTRNSVTARWVINAAGLYSDVIDRMLGHDSFTVTPRRGQLIVFDKVARPLLSRVLLPVPSAKTKGVLIAPTVFGNVLLGPTAEDLTDKTATETTAEGLAGLLDKGRPILPDLAAEQVTATYAGLRAATGESDYQIDSWPDEHYICVGGIRSTGLSSSLGIADYVLDLLGDARQQLRDKEETQTPHMPMIGEAFTRPYQDEAAIAADATCGHIVCHCERVTEAEIIAATRAPIPARDLNGLRRRTRAMMGRCQGFYCTANVSRLFADATGQTLTHLFAEDEQQ